jgi:hypothetical protein
MTDTITILIATLVAVVTARHAARRVLRGRRPEDVLTLVAAVIATGVQGTGMWRFFGVTLHLDGPLRALLFAFIEIALFVEALRARRTVIETGAAGVDGVAVWALAALSAVLSSLDARSFAEALFRLSVPPVTAWLWERLMAVERRRSTGRRIHWRVTPERILVRLGLAEASDRTASEVDAHRRLTRVALAAHRLRSLRAAGARGWRQWRAQRRLDAAVRAAVEHAGLAIDEQRQGLLMAQLGALFNTTALAELSPAAPWAAPTRRPALRLYRLGEEPVRPVPGVPPASDAHLTRAADVFADEVRRGEAPSIRTIKRRLQVGQDRAREVQAYLAALAERQTVPAEVN